MEGCLMSGEAERGGAWGIDLRRLGCGCGRRLVTDTVRLAVTARRRAFQYCKKPTHDFRPPFGF